MNRKSLLRHPNILQFLGASVTVGRSPVILQELHCGTVAELVCYMISTSTYAQRCRWHLRYIVQKFATFQKDFCLVLRIFTVAHCHTVCKRDRLCSSL